MLILGKETLVTIFLGLRKGQKLNITEKDLYTYVFNSSGLSSTKLKYISNNKKLFQKELQLLTELKEVIENQKVEDKVLSKIKSKIAEFNQQDNIELKLVNISHELDNKYLIPDIENWASTGEIQVKTFATENNSFIVKAISTKKETCILVFNKELKEYKEFKITILPSKEIFEISNSSSPIVLTPKREINSIIINLFD